MPEAFCRAWPVSVLAGLIVLMPSLALASGNEATVTSDKILWMAGMCGLALLILALCAWRGAALFGALGAMLILGSAAQMWLTQPLWFPRLQISLSRPSDLLMLAVLACQGALAIFVLVSRLSWNSVRSAANRFGQVQILLFTVLTAAFTVSVMGYVGHGYWMSFAVQIVVGGALVALHLMTLAALLTVPPPVAKVRISPVLLALVGFLSALALGGLAFQHVPHVEDEVAYLFQAKTFAAGEITTPAPPPAALPGLDYYLLQVSDEGWFSTTAPGWPAVLALGVLVGMPWLVNPVLTGLSVLLAYGVVARAATEDRARLVALLMATSPFVLAVGATYMTHALTLFLMLLAWWCLLQARSRASDTTASLLALGAGLAMGWVFTTRPLDGLIAGGLTGLWLIAGAWRARQGAALVLSYGGGCILTGAVFLWYNWMITGNPLSQPLTEYIDALWGPGANAFGFGPDIGPPDGWGALDRMPGHSLTEGLLNTANGLASVNFETLGWSIGALAPIWAALIWGRVTRGLDLAMLILLLTVIGLMLFYWFSGTFYVGPRYWYVAVVPLIVLAACGIEAVQSRLDQPAQARLPVLILLLCTISLFGFSTWRSVTKYHGYGGFTAEILTRYQRGEFGSALVFVSSDRNIGSALFLNDPTLSEDNPIFFLDLGEVRNADIAAAFPDRKVLRITTAN